MSFFWGWSTPFRLWKLLESHVAPTLFWNSLVHVHYFSIYAVPSIEASYPHHYCLSSEKFILLVHRSAKQLDSASGQLTLSRHVSCALWWNNFYRYRGILNPLRFSEEPFLSARQLVLLMHAHSESESNANGAYISFSVASPAHGEE